MSTGSPLDMCIKEEHSSNVVMLPNAAEQRYENFNLYPSNLNLIMKEKRKGLHEDSSCNHNTQQQGAV